MGAREVTDQQINSAVNNIALLIAEAKLTRDERVMTETSLQLLVNVIQSLADKQAKPVEEVNDGDPTGKPE